jgi:tRNA pseudouridine(55) synthase
MLEVYKKRGETPLAALNRLRNELPELADETLSYAGRLDPMAEGILPVLVGEEENRARKEFLGKDKQYVAHFMLGYQTDTGDVLGIVEKQDVHPIDEAEIEKAVHELAHITEQTYPWYSSKTVDGIPLFEYARAGNFSVERPVRDIKIHAVTGIDISSESDVGLIKDIVTDIESVKGDFRQHEITGRWNSAIEGKMVQMVSCVLEVSSGTYIRALTEVLSEKLGIPVVLYRLIRTRVF